MIECNDLYDYGYKIFQNKNYFKFSIDSILLSEFVNFKKNDCILDLCTGNAPIPMILTSKCQNLKIDAVEIQEEIYLLAKKSIEINKLNNITLYNDDIKKIDLKSKYDIITCNPPYYKIGDSTYTSKDKVKKIARHEITITLEEIVDIAYDKLKENGNFYLVHKTERFIDVIMQLERKNFGIRKIAFVYTKKEKNAEFFLIEASKYKKSDPKIISLYIEELKTYKNIFKEVSK